MTRLDRVLNLLEKYDALAVNHYENISDWWDVLAECRREKEKLTQELIEHGCRRGVDIISQDIFSEKVKMKKETWCG